MTQETTNVTLRETFEKTFPEYALRLNAATTQNELEEVYNQIVAECRDKVKATYKNSSDESLLGDDAGEGIPPILLDSDTYNGLLKADGDKIKTYVTELLNALQLAKPYLDHDDTKAATTQLVAAGIVAFTIEGVSLYFSTLAAGATTFEAALKVVTSCKNVIIEAIALVSTLVIIPLVYFMEKPAANIMVLLNDTGERIDLIDDNCVATHAV